MALPRGTGVFPKPVNVLELADDPARVLKVSQCQRPPLVRLTPHNVQDNHNKCHEHERRAQYPAKDVAVSSVRGGVHEMNGTACSGPTPTDPRTIRQASPTGAAPNARP